MYYKEGIMNYIENMINMLKYDFEQEEKLNKLEYYVKLGRVKELRMYSFKKNCYEKRIRNYIIKKNGRYYFI